MENDKYIPSALCLLGIVFIIYSLQYRVGSFNAPGNGFFPIVCAAGLVGLSSVLLMKSVRLAQKNRNSQTNQGPPKESVQVGKLCALIAVLVLFASLHNVLGYWVSVFGTMVALVRIAADSNWKWCVFGGVVTTIIGYLIFEYWMGAYFPKGVIGL